MLLAAVIPLHKRHENLKNHFMQLSSARAEAGNWNCSLDNGLMAPNAKQLDKITGIKFKTDIVVNTDHCPNFVKKTDVQSDSVAFTVHIPFEQLKCWYDNKLSLLADCSYIQILNAFLSKRYSIKIRENCSRLEKCLRLNCSKAAKKMVGKHGGNRRRLSTKTKSMVIYHDELSTVALIMPRIGFIHNYRA